MRCIKKSTQKINANGRDCELSYYVLIEEENSWTDNKEYGIRIALGEEENEVFRITNKEKEIERLIKLLSTYKVFPVHLLDVLEDVM